MSELVWFLLSLFVFFLLLVFSALPLHFGVILMRGRTNLLKSTLVMTAVSVLVSLLFMFIPWGIGVFISLPIVLYIYGQVFFLVWYRAILVWIIQVVFIMLFTFLFAIIGQDYLAVTSINYWFT